MGMGVLGYEEWRLRFKKQLSNKIIILVLFVTVPKIILYDMRKTKRKSCYIIYL